MKAIVLKREERNRQLLTQAFTAAEADSIQNSSGIEDAAESTNQREKGLGEANPVGAGLDRLIGQMAYRSLDCLIDASLDVQVVAPRAMRMAPELRGLRPLSSARA